MPGARNIRDEMQGVAPKPKVYGAPMGPEQSVSGVQRPTVGQAPLNIQRQAIAAHEAQSAREARAGLYQKPVGSQATPVPRPQPTTPQPGLGVPGAQPAPAVLGAAQQIQGRRAMIDQAVKDAQ